MNNYQKVKNTLSILKFSVLLAISIAVVVLYCAVFGIMGSDGLDAEFAQYKTEAQTVTKTYAIEESGVLHFFNSESDEAKLTVFTNTWPRLNIVNDDIL